LSMRKTAVSVGMICISIAIGTLVIGSLEDWTWVDSI